ncbi:hypothetical protein BFW01_g11762 [Lasiodiplodia theobromae]|nr:hypothetical protein BFW01_g11762 [Lasiodiplodia theobromae]
MTSSPEAVFMDQVYIAILDVARKIKSRMGQQDTCSATLFKFIDVTTLLVKLFSKWDEAGYMRGLVNTWLCCIGDVLVNGLAERLSKTELDRQSLVGSVLPALLASDEASDVSQFLFHQAYDSAIAEQLVELVQFMVTQIDQLGETFDDELRYPIGGGTTAQDTSRKPTLNFAVGNQEESGLYCRLRSMFKPKSKGDT